MGLSPGDGTFAEPYFYLLPWPSPPGELPKLDGGHWHTEGWTGAVLEASEFTSGSSNGAQRDADRKVFDLGGVGLPPPSGDPS